MKNGKILILLLTVVFLLLAVGIGYMEPAQEPDTGREISISIIAMLDGQEEKIRCWEAEGGDYIAFLPSGAELSDVTLYLADHSRAFLLGEPLESGTNCGNFQLNTPYWLTTIAEGITIDNTLTFVQSARLPSMHVDVLSGSMEIIHETKGNEESGSLRLYSPEGEFTYSGHMESLKGRGNSSWFRDKKPYSLTLAGEADLLGMGQAKNWILLANAMDPSHLRNKVVYDMAAKAGMAYAPECQWVDLYLNGEYAGVYLLIERNEIHPQRLDLQETGSFLVSRESAWRLVSQNYPRVLLDSGAALRVHDSGLTETDLYEIWQPVDNAILADDGIDPITGKSWQELIDLDSWAMDYLTGEIFGNLDAGSISEYYYRDSSDPSGKIYAGPVWDYDLSMGSKNFEQTGFVQAFFADKAHTWSLEDSTWFYGLNRKPEFQNRVKELYKEVYRPLMQELLDTGLEEYADFISQAAEMNQLRWGVTSAREETEHIHWYLTERLAFLDSLWLEDTQYYQVLVMYEDDETSLCHAVLPGERIPALPVYNESWDILGWYDADTDEPFDISQPIYKDTTVYLKRLPGEEDRISPLQAVPIVAVLVILLAGILTDAKRRRKRKRKQKKPIVKQGIV